MLVVRQNGHMERKSKQVFLELPSDTTFTIIVNLDY